MNSHETKAEARKAVKAIFDEKFTNIPTEKSSSKLSKDILSAELFFPAKRRAEDILMNTMKTV